MKIKTINNVRTNINNLKEIQIQIYHHRVSNVVCVILRYLRHRKRLSKPENREYLCSHKPSRVQGGLSVT